MSDNIFQAEINSALTELQGHLQGLGTAKNEIETTRQAAASVVSGVERLSGDYSKHLDELKAKVDAFLKESAAHSKGFHSETAMRIKQLQENYERKSQLMVGNIQSAQNQETKVFYERSSEQILNFLNSTNESIEAAVTEMNKQIGFINDMHNRQNGQVKEYMVRFERLMRAVHEMEERLSTINFPELFDGLRGTLEAVDNSNQAMSQDLLEFKKQIRSDMRKQTQALETRIQSQTGSLRLMLFVLLLTLGVCAYMAYQLMTR